MLGNLRRALDRVWNEMHREDTKDTKYFSLLPADAKPPLDLNREMMERFRPEMRKYYLNRKPRFN